MGKTTWAFLATNIESGKKKCSKSKTVLADLIGINRKTIIDLPKTTKGWYIELLKVEGNNCNGNTDSLKDK